MPLVMTVPLPDAVLQVFDPSSLPPEDYLDALTKEQKEEEERRKAARAAGQGRVEFTKSGGWLLGDAWWVPRRLGPRGRAAWSSQSRAGGRWVADAGQRAPGYGCWGCMRRGALFGPVT